MSSKKTQALRRGLQVVAVSVVACLFGLLVWKLVTEDEGRELVAAVRAGEQPAAPAVNLPVLWTEEETWPARARSSLEDRRLSLTELAGQPVVLNFWASWCEPCKKEAPLLADAARSERGRVLFLGVDVQDLRSAARQFLREYKANYPSLHDGPGNILSKFGLTGLPETYYLDARHRIVGHTVGELSPDELAAGVSAATRRPGS